MDLLVTLAIVTLLTRLRFDEYPWCMMDVSREGSEFQVADGWNVQARRGLGRFE